MRRIDRILMTIERVPLSAIIIALCLLLAIIHFTTGCAPVGQRTDVERPTLMEARAVAEQQVLVTTLATACRHGDQAACDRLAIEDKVLMRLLEMGHGDN